MQGFRFLDTTLYGRQRTDPGLHLGQRLGQRANSRFCFFEGIEHIQQYHPVEFSFPGEFERRHVFVVSKVMAGNEAVALFRRLGQLMELEIELPIWWMYLAFPTGFAILALFAVELMLETIMKLWRTEEEAR